MLLFSSGSADQVFVSFPSQGEKENISLRGSHKVTQECLR